MNDATDDRDAVDARIKPAPGSTEDEQILWSATPGHVTNLHIYVVAVIAAAVLGIYAPWPWVGLALIPLTVAGDYAAALQATRYELTSQRLRKKWGLLSRRGEEVELYRVEDTNPTAPLLYRLAGRKWTSDGSQHHDRFRLAMP